MTGQGLPTPTPPEKPWYEKCWIWALIALGVVIVAAALTATPEEEAAAPASTTSTTPASESMTTVPDETTTSTQATTASTTTTQPPTATTLPAIGSGTYIVPDEGPNDTYRLAGYAARLDDGLEIGDNYLIDDNGFGVVIVQPTDSYLEINGEIVTVEAFGHPLDPIAAGFTNGV
jgi:hypothetical protein